MRRKNFLITLLGFIWARKAYWLLPVIVLLVILIALIVTGTSPVAPFIYTVM
ncbi:hypothetical protein IJ670_03400 [bacterium]|nr:hypothetical protein [bacterium]